MLKNLQLTLALTLGIIVLCLSAIILHLYTWNFVAQQQGYHTDVYYRGRVSGCNLFIPNEDQKEFRRIYDLYEAQIKKGEPFPEKQAFDALNSKFNADNALLELSSAGIFALFSFTGLMILWINRKRIPMERRTGQLKLFTWLFVFIALYCHWFIMEFVFTLMEFSIGVPLEFNAWITWLADSTDISGWVFLICSCLLSLVLLVYIAFRIVPRRQLIPFLIAGFVGGILGRLIWYSWLGPVVMPYP